MVVTSNRNTGDAHSLFIDLKNGELHRADFAEGSCSAAVIDQVKARRGSGSDSNVGSSAEKVQHILRFEGKKAVQ